MPHGPGGLKPAGTVAQPLQADMKGHGVDATGEWGCDAGHFRVAGLASSHCEQ
jgi:hypothetical protein